MAQQTVLTRDLADLSRTRGFNDAGDEAVLSRIEGTQAVRSLWADAAATSPNVGTGANITAIQIGVAATTATIPGNLDVQGTTTTLSTTNTTISDNLLLLNAGAAVEARSGIAIERGATGDDTIIYYNTSPNRIEFGFFDTVGGTVTPAGALPAADLAILRSGNISMGTVGGSQITSDSGLVVQATNANLVLRASSGGNLELGTAGGSGTTHFIVQNAGHFVSTPDNTNDLGNLGALRPRTGYFGTSVVVGNSVSITSAAVTGSAALDVAATGANNLTLTARGTSYSVTVDGAALATTDQTIIGAINEANARVDSWSAVLGEGETSGGTNPILTSGDEIQGAPGVASIGAGATLRGGAGDGAFSGGIASLIGGNSGTGATGDGGGASILAGNSLATNGNGGSVGIIAGSPAGSGTAGTIDLFTGGSVRITVSAAGNILFPNNDQVGTDDTGTTVTFAPDAYYTRASGVFQEGANAGPRTQVGAGVASGGRGINVDGASLFLGQGGVARWEVNSAGAQLRPNLDNSTDLGDAGRRVRNAYVGTTVFVGAPAVNGIIQGVDGTTTAGGGLNIVGGDSLDAGVARPGGDLVLAGGIGSTGGAGGNGGPATLSGGNGGGASGTGGAATVRGGFSIGASQGGGASVSGGGSSGGLSGNVSIAGETLAFQHRTGGGSLTTRWTVTNTGHFVAGLDNSYDVGTPGALRPRTVHVGTSVVVGSTVTITTGAVTGSGALGISSTGANNLTLTTRGASYIVSGDGAALTTTSQTIIGAINEVDAAIGAAATLTAVLAAGNLTGNNGITFDFAQEISGASGVSPIPVSMRGGTNTGAGGTGSTAIVVGGAGNTTGAGGQGLVSGGNAGNAGVGGLGLVRGGNSGGSGSGAGGGAQLLAGDALGTGDGGAATVTGGGTVSAAGGAVLITAGAGVTAGGAVTINSGAGSTGNSGEITIQPATGNAAGGNGGNLKLQGAHAGASASSTPGSVDIWGGSANTGNVQGGNVLMLGGSGRGNQQGGAIGGTAGIGGATSGQGGLAFLRGGQGGLPTGVGGIAEVTGGAGRTSANGGTVNVTGGRADIGAGTGVGGFVNIVGGQGGGTSGDGGDVDIRGGTAVSGNHGRIIFRSGSTTYGLTVAGVGPALTTTAQTIIEAINEVAAGGASATTVTETLTNANAGTITVGQAVYITTTTNNVDLANATANNALADVVAFVQDASILTTASGEFVTAGTATVRLVAGLGARSSGDKVYLSATAGSCTTTEPVASGNVSQPVGIIKSPLTYDGTADFLVEIIIRMGNKAVSP